MISDGSSPGGFLAALQVSCFKRGSGAPPIRRGQFLCLDLYRSRSTECNNLFLGVNIFGRKNVTKSGESHCVESIGFLGVLVFFFQEYPSDGG